MIQNLSFSEAMTPTRKSLTKKSSSFMILNQLKSLIPKPRSSNCNVVTSAISRPGKVANGLPSSRKVPVYLFRRLSSSVEQSLLKFPLAGTLDAMEFPMTSSLKSIARLSGRSSAPLRLSMCQASLTRMSSTNTCTHQRSVQLLEVAWVVQLAWARCLRTVATKRMCRTTFCKRRMFSLNTWAKLL